MSGPQDFTSLPRDTVLDTVRVWGHLKVKSGAMPTALRGHAVGLMPAQSRGHGTRATILVAGVLLLAGALYWFLKPETAPPHAFAAAPFQRQFEVWDNTTLPSVQFQREADGVWACRLESPGDTKRLNAWLKSTAGRIGS